MIEQVLNNIEFYNSPEGDVMVKPLGQPVFQLTEKNRGIISALITIIADRYPSAFSSLMALYSVNNTNRCDYEYRVVHRFLRCNFGSYDQLRIDIDGDGKMHFEEVMCPLRGECQFDGIICRPKLNSELTNREMEVVELLVSSPLTNEEIAQKLFISPITVKRHIGNVMAKLGCHSRTELVKWWYNKKEEGL